MAVAILLPAAVFSAVSLALLLESERESARRSVYESVKLVSQAVDRELSRAESSLQVLASSEKLAREDLPGFHERLVRNQATTGTWTLLTDAQGQLLLSSLEPYGTPLPRRTDPGEVPRILAQPGATVSSLFVGARVKRPIVAIHVPVRAASGNQYVLSQAFMPEYFNRVLAQAQPPGHWLIGLFDQKGVTIARTHRAQEFVGTPANAELVKAAQSRALGELRHTSREGIEVFDVFLRSPMSGWTVAIGVPVANLDSPALHAVALAGMGLLVTLMVGVWLALANGKRLADAITRAAQAAGMIGRAELEPARGLRLAEIDSLHEAMQQAHQDLMREKDARADAEAGRAALYASEQAARALAEAQNKAKDDFLAMLGHELRNPLSAIAGAVEVVKLRGGDAASVQQAHEVIARQSHHLSHIVDDLLDVSRVMSGKIRLTLEPIDLSAKVRRVLATLDAAGRTGAHVVQLQLEEAWINADLTRLDQIVTNLLVNAFKYTPDGGTVTVQVQALGDEAVLTVTDTGVGMDAALLPTIFDVFVQGSPALDRAQGGLGIGLSLVRQLMSLHGASITAASGGPGQGSSFVARFVRIAAPVSPAVPQAPAAQRNLRVLLVEDHPDARDTLCELLQLSGHECLTASDGLEGIARAVQESPDVAIVDIGLPGLNGYEVAARLRADPATRGMKLVALTGYGQEQDRRRALDAGFDAHLVKPINVDQMLRLLQELAAGG
jgi:signal transduction histidine kinase/ActR/RegA family two-component response regulator